MQSAKNAMNNVFPWKKKRSSKEYKSKEDDSSSDESINFNK